MTTKATYKALREHVGISHASLAKLLGVAERTVKRWEDDRYNDPPQDAFDLLLALREKQLSIADYAIELAQTAGTETVRLNYYRTQAQYDKYGRDEGDYRMANANARTTATALETMGFEVVYAYPDEPEYVDTPMNDE